MDCIFYYDRYSSFHYDATAAKYCSSATIYDKSATNKTNDGSGSSGAESDSASDNGPNWPAVKYFSKYIGTSSNSDHVGVSNAPSPGSSDAAFAFASAKFTTRSSCSDDGFRVN